MVAGRVKPFDVVVTACLPTSPTATPHERTAWPSSITVQAPQIASPQPNLVPVRLSSSRRYQSSASVGSTSVLWSWPFIRNVIMKPSPSGFFGIVGAKSGYR